MFTDDSVSQTAFYLGERSSEDASSQPPATERPASASPGGLTSDFQTRHGHQSMQSTVSTVTTDDPLSTPTASDSQAIEQLLSSISSAHEYKGNARRPIIPSSGASVSGVSPLSPTTGAFPHDIPVPASRPQYTHSRSRSRSRSRTYARDSFANPPRMLYNGERSPFVSAVALVDSKHASLHTGRSHARKPAVRRMKPTAITDTDLASIEKPWLTERDPLKQLSYMLSLGCMLLGIGASVALCYFGAKSILFVGSVCLVMEDDFSNGLDTSIWAHEVSMGGFGNGEFEMATASPNNSYVEDGILYIVPTLTADEIGESAIFNGYTYNITGCTTLNATACGAVSNITTQNVINPVQSARLSTVNSTSIKYGRIEVIARLPEGDWLWPAIWMLPVNNTYGPWPMSGEIDIMEARGNAPSYPAQGRNYVRSSLNWGPTTFINSVAKTFGWWRERHFAYSDGFHKYTLEWNEEFLRCYVDDRNTDMLQLKFNKPFFERGDYPQTVINGSAEIPLTNPWVNAGDNAAPFDQQFYLILDVAVGGTQGWFPDGLGNKPWLDGSNTAMYDFARSQDEWYLTWPSDPKRRGMAVSSVKMWQKC
ncbi:hypothetical protein EW145_g5982 [Phellinidium pouzarii]|uniref:GH16 domain-containing protein n=1 Tax=Phellinidium pouzarii TaxID=167371 RepID=A0A4S4KY42_9AGAM|nr:hypothetical protein EW145_g5982 [Phellinidium pouzarii]